MVAGMAVTFSSIVASACIRITMMMGSSYTCKQVDFEEVSTLILPQLSYDLVPKGANAGGYALQLKIKEC